MQYSQLFLQSMAQGSTMTKDPRSGVSTHLLTIIKACYDQVLVQSNQGTDCSSTEGPDLDAVNCGASSTVQVAPDFQARVE